MEIIDFLINLGDKLIPFLRTIITILVFFVIFNIIFNIIKKALLKKAKTKKQISNIKIFSRIFRYLILVVLIIFAIFSYAGSWTGLGVSVGLFSAALGWALQKPITGIAGWIMVVIKRPFDIGDRIIIGNVRGDVEDISLTHIYVKEIGGIIGGEENSGRIVMVPNSKLFEQDITNYTQEDEYMLDQVAVNITYESNIDKAIKIAVEAAKKHTKDIIKKTNKEPYTLTYFTSNGIDLRVRYFSPTKKLQRISSAITKEIYDKVSKEKDVRFAYPHNEVILNKKK